MTLKDRREKIEWLRSLSPKGPVLLEGGYLWGDPLLDHLPCAIGVHGGSFFSPTRTIEIFLKDKGRESLVRSLFDNLGVKVHFVSTLGIGFTYPRVVALLINEATRTREDGVAAPEAINTALRFGLGHPLGPFEWKDKIGASLIVKLLDELHTVTGDPRYRASVTLRREAQ